MPFCRVEWKVVAGQNVGLILPAPVQTCESGQSLIELDWARGPEEKGGSDGDYDDGQPIPDGAIGPKL